MLYFMGCYQIVQVTDKLWQYFIKEWQPPSIKEYNPLLKWLEVTLSLQAFEFSKTQLALLD